MTTKNTYDNQSTVTLAMTGASGADYGIRLLECLLTAGKRVYLLVSPAAQVVLAPETQLKVPSQPKEMQSYFCKRYDVSTEQLQVFGKEQWMAPVASGSNAPHAMVICPCTTGTLSAVACGASDNLIERAADVMLKEQRKLIMVIRETPFSAIHLENMLTLARLGVVILPANPGFYHQPKSITDIVDFVVARILDHLAIPHDLMSRWGDQQ
jgi:4-hydroxy-3-polyprenylbenzoate decarboxylase